MTNFSLDQLRPTRQIRPVRVLNYGPHKIGKTTWASQSQDPAFIITEDGQDVVDAMAFPLCLTWDDLLGWIGVLYNEEHGKKTVVLDSLDWAEQLAHKKVCKDRNVKNVSDIGYSKGYLAAADLFKEMLQGFDALRLERGMQVILLAHAEVKRYDDPTSDSYDRYQIKLHKTVSQMVQEWVDIIGFSQLEVYTTDKQEGFGKERTRATDGGRRVIRFAPSAAYDAGSRFDLPSTLNLVWSEFEQALKQAQGDK